MNDTKDSLDLARVLDAVAESVLVTTVELEQPGPKIVYANPSFFRMTGWTVEEIIGKSPRILQGRKTDLGIFKNMRTALFSSGYWEGQTVNYKKDGSEFVMEWSINSLAGPLGKTEFYVAVQRDVTVQVENEKRLKIATEAAEEADRKKMNLARYFSPKKVALLTERNSPLGPVRRQNVAVLIVDIIGFTAMSEAMRPERVVALLRSFYERMAAVIFANEGSIENFAGDSLLAVFGAPDEGDRDANNAILCALEMAAAMKNWNKKRLSAGRQRIDVGISAHFGEVVLGDIGTEQSMSFTVIGDPVNVTSRLQKLCRVLGSEIVISQELMSQALAEKGSEDAKILKFVDRGTHTLQGREEPVKVLSLDKGKS